MFYGMNRKSNVQVNQSGIQYVNKIEEYETKTNNGKYGSQKSSFQSNNNIIAYFVFGFLFAALLISFHSFYLSV